MADRPPRPPRRHPDGRAWAIGVLVGAPVLLLAVVLIVGALLPGPVTRDVAVDGADPAAPTSAPASAGPAAVAYDHATWCSPERGDCVEVELPRIAGFGGGSVVTRLPAGPDADGCS